VAGVTRLPREWSHAGLEAVGFEGFVPLAALGRSEAPKNPGIYIVLREGQAQAEFLPRSIAGHFKGVDSTVERAVLEAAWIPDTSVLYIGKARWGIKRDGLRRRLSQYRRHGAGRAVGHRGGEYIWQVAGSEAFLVCWKVVDDEAVDQFEADLIDAFEFEHGRWPFANRKHERRRGTTPPVA
jgi:hypothetical protein